MGVEEILSIINVIGVIGATVISTITLFTTKSLQKMEQKVNIMANKRSERIDKMREYSSSIISNSKRIIYDIEPNDAKINLICATDNFVSLLQYEYLHDIELIDGAKNIVEISLSTEIDIDLLRANTERFWKMCDIYVGVEYERLKNESKGLFNKSGAVKKESDTFEDIYQKLLSEQK